MKKVWIALPILAFCVFYYPIQHEAAVSSCHALEKKFLATTSKDWEDQDPATVAIGMRFASAVSSGRIATDAVKEIHPNVPPVISCTIAYYDLVVDPNGAMNRIRRNVMDHSSLIDPARVQMPKPGYDPN